MRTATAVAFCSIAVASIIVRYQPVSGVGTLALAVGALFSPAAAAAALILAIWARRALVAVCAAAVLTVATAIQVPWYFLGRTDGPDGHIAMRVLSANLRLGRADPSSVVRLATEYADLLLVSELTPEAVEELRRAGIDNRFPDSQLVPKAGAGGIGIWSRHPLVTLPVKQNSNLVVTAAQVRIPGIRPVPVVASIHVFSPVAFSTDTVARWSDGMAETKALLHDLALAAGSAAVIVGGDFNSTPDLRQFRELLTTGYHDAVQQSGSGFAPTFPAGGIVPPLITIDHILTRKSSVSAVRTISLEGSDHRALLATVTLTKE